MEIAFQYWLIDQNTNKIKKVLGWLCGEDPHPLSPDSTYSLSEKYEAKIENKFGSVLWKDIPTNVFHSQMKVAYRQDLSVNGIRLDVLKSGIQKYIRRNVFVKGMWCAVELDLFTYSTDKRARGIRTNFIHRLMINYLEEIAIANPRLWFRISGWIDTLFEARNERVGLTLKDEKFREVRRIECDAVCNLMRCMCESPHIRSLSHLRTIFYYVQGDKNLQKFIKRYHPKIANIIRNSPKGEPKYIFPLKGKEVKTAVLRGDVNNFVLCVEDENIMAVYWAFKIVMGNKGKVETHLRCRKPEYLIFDILLRMARRNEDAEMVDYLEIGIKWFKEINTKEDFMCWLMPLMLMIGMGDFELDDLNNRVCGCSEEGWIKRYGVNLSNEVIEIDDYVLDMHTREGKGRGMGGVEFALEGSYVVNESGVIDDELRRVYTGYKVFSLAGKREYERLFSNNEVVHKVKEEVEEGELPKESDVFEFRIRTQLTTTNHKPDTYFAYEKRSDKGVFVKGPYLRKDIIKYPLKVAKIKEKFDGIRVIRQRRIDLVPDLFTSPLGTRTKLVEDEVYPFLVSDDVCGLDEYPVLLKNTVKYTNEPVVDWKKVIACRPAVVLWLYENDWDAFREYVIGVLFRYVWGIPDYADRNFIYLPESHQIYTVDDEGMMSTKKPTVQLRKRKSGLIKDYLEENYDEIKEVVKRWKSNLVETKEIVSKEEYEFAKKRLDEISSLSGLVAPFS